MCSGDQPGDRRVILEQIRRIEVCKDRLSVWVKSHDANEVGEEADSTVGNLVSIPWQKPPGKKFRQILLPHGVSRQCGPTEAY